MRGWLRSELMPEIAKQRRRSSTLPDRAVEMRSPPCLVKWSSSLQHGHTIAHHLFLAPPRHCKQEKRCCGVWEGVLSCWSWKYKRQEGRRGAPQQPQPQPQPMASSHLLLTQYVPLPSPQADAPGRAPAGPIEHASEAPVRQQGD
jgi:hypothetical protein